MKKLLFIASAMLIGVSVFCQVEIENQNETLFAEEKFDFKSNVNSNKLFNLGIVYNPEKSRGIPASPYPYSRQLPDGSYVQLTIHGDGVVHWEQTLDGYTVIPDEFGHYFYAYLNKTNKLVRSSILVSSEGTTTAEEIAFKVSVNSNMFYSEEQIQERVQSYYTAENSSKNSIKSFPTTGSRKLVTILVEYSDVTFTRAQSEFNDLFNSANYTLEGAQGSVKEYYSDNSFTQLDLTSDVVGPYTLPNNMAYYGGNDGSGNDLRPQEMISDAINLANVDVDFSDYDNDGDGEVDGVYIVFAGYSEASGGPASSIWPHRWSLPGAGETLDGILIDDYACSNELYGNSGTLITGIGVVCHEFGHSCGLPDYYDTDYAGSGGQSFTLGDWDVMDGGSYNNFGKTPPFFNSYSRNLLGWQTSTHIFSPTSISLLNTAQNNVSYYFTTTTANEYFMVENRQQISWDAYIPHHGMIIYRVDQDYIDIMGNSFNTVPTHQGFDLIEADNVQTNPTLTGDPFPGTSSNTSFTDATTPSSQSLASANTSKPITDIVEAAQVITFDFMGGAVAGVPVADFTADQTSVLLGTTINFADLSTGIPDTWLWTLDGGTPSSSTDQHPSVTYNSPGQFDVTLYSENSSGDDEITKSNYISVIAAPQTCEYIDNVETGDNITAYTSGGGWLTGINGNNFTEFAEYYDSHLHNEVAGVKMYVNEATANSADPKITMKVWDVSGGLPNAEIYSEDFPIGDFTAGAYNNITFTTPVTVGDEFFIGYQIYTTIPQDTFAVYQIQDRGVASPITSSGFLKFSGTWRDIDVLFSGLNTSLLIYPEICPTVPIAEFSADVLTGCVPLTVQFTDESTPNVDTWFWDFGDGNTSTEWNPEHIYTVPGTYTVELQSTNSTGTGTETKTDYITVEEPTAVTVSGGGLSCTGSATLTASGGTGGTIYWQNTTSGGTSTATASSSESVSSAGTYYFRAQSAGGCWGTEGSATVTLSSGTPAQPGAITGTEEQCPSLEGETYSIDAVTDATTYNWTVPTGWSITAGSGTVSITVTAGTAGENGDITVTAENSCGTSTASTLAVTVGAISTAPTLVSGASSGCSQSPYQLTVSGGTEGSGASYQWYAGGCGSGGILNTIETLDASIAATTTYYVRRTDDCGVTTACTSFTLNITDPTPTSVNTNDYVWVGNWNNDWNESSNWLRYNGASYDVPPGAPDATRNVIIASDVSCVNNPAAITTDATSLCNNLTIDVGANFGNTARVRVLGDFTNNGTFNASTGTIEFVGSALQTIDAGGSDFSNVIFNNTLGANADIDIATPMIINGVGTFTSGIVYYSGTGSLIFGNSASTTNSSGSSFVNELVSKTGSGAFVFPIGDIVTLDLGDGNQTYVVYGGLGITPSASTTATVEYLFAGSGQDCWAHDGNMDTGLHHVSDRENWIVNSTVDLTNVTMYWDNNVHGIGGVCVHGLCDGTNPFVGSNLLVSYWNGTKWINSGVAAGSSSLTHDTGYIQSSAVLPFSAKGSSILTFGSKAKETPLPVELLDFSTDCKDATTVLSWTTASEINNDYFILEKSDNAEDYVKMAVVDGLGDSNIENTYTVYDKEKYKTTSYYRLSQVDFNGQHTILGIVASDCRDMADDEIIFKAYPNPFTDELNIYIEAKDESKFELNIYNELGQNVYSKILYGTDYPYENILDLSTLKSGMYYLKLQSQKQIVNQKIIKK